MVVLTLLHSVKTYLRPYLPLPSAYAAWFIPINAAHSLEEIDRLALAGDFPVVGDLSGAVIYFILLGLVRLVLQKYGFKVRGVFP